MSALKPDTGAVLRGAALHPESLRIGRHGPTPVVRTPAAASAPSSPSAAPAVDPRKLHEAVLASAREEGLRLGREEGERVGREEGRRAGHEEGLKKSQAEAQAAAAAALEKAVAEAAGPLRERERRLEALMASISRQEASWRESAEDEAVALAYELACRVLGDALVTPEGVRAQARELRGANRGAVAFHVHPDDVPLLCKDTDEDARWVADPAVATGGCLVKSSSGTLDARLDTLLDECRQALLEVRARREGGTA